MIATIDGEPEVLVAGAIRLNADADRLRVAAERLGALAELGASGWSGAAAMSFRARAEVVRRGVLTGADELRGVAAASRAHATQLETAQHQLRSLAAAYASAKEDSRRALAAASLPTDPVAHASASRDLAEARRRMHECSMRADRVRQDHDAAARRFAQVVSASDPWSGAPPVLQEWRATRTVVGDVGGLISEGRLLAGHMRAQLAVGRMARAAETLKAAGRTGRATVKHARAVEAAKEASDRLRGAPGSATHGAWTVGQLWARRVNLVGTAAEGTVDVLRGDPEHGGLRDATTRIIGAAGAGGAAVLLLAPATPVVAGTAAGCVVAYGAWKTGTYLWDNREQVASALRRAKNWTTRAFSAALRKGKVVVRSAGDKVVGLSRWGWRQTQTHLPLVAAAAEHSWDAAKRGAEMTGEALGSAMEQGERLAHAGDDLRLKAGGAIAGVFSR